MCLQFINSRARRRPETEKDRAFLLFSQYHKRCWHVRLMVCEATCDATVPAERRQYREARRQALGGAALIAPAPRIE